MDSFARTQLTAAPRKQQFKLEPVVVPRAESATLPERIQREHAQRVVVVVGHSDTLPTLLKALADADCASKRRISATCLSSRRRPAASRRC